MATTDRYQQLTDDQWARIEPLLPSSDGRRGRPFRNSRQILEGVIYRYRTGIPWRDLPEYFGPWQTVWKRHRRYTVDGTWDRILQSLLADADAAGLISWIVSVDATINRAHQHPTRTAHRGHSRITRIRPVLILMIVNLQVTGLGGRGEG